jgi:hypothetical protein
LLQLNLQACYNSICNLQSGDDDVEVEEVLDPSLYHDIRKGLLNDTKNKIKVQIVGITKMFIQTYDAMLIGNS